MCVRAVCVFSRACVRVYVSWACVAVVCAHSRACLRVDVSCACAVMSRVHARPLCTCAFTSERARRRLVCVSAVCMLSTSPVNIKISENATPYHLNVARRVPIPLVPKVESELRRMERDGVIKKEQTPWWAPMIAAIKKPDKLRSYIDLKQLNKVAQ